MHGIIISLYIVYVHRVPKSYPVWLNIFSHTCKSWLHLICQITIHVILGHPDCQPCLPLFPLQFLFENQSSKNNNSWKWLQDFLSPQLSFMYMYMYILCVILHSCTHGYVHLSLYSTKECFQMAVQPRPQAPPRLSVLHAKKWEKYGVRHSHSSTLLSLLIDTI